MAKHEKVKGPKEADKGAAEIIVAAKPRHKEVDADTAQLLARIGFSVAQRSDRARLVLDCYLKSLAEQPAVSSEEARAVLAILQQTATTIQRNLCDKVLSNYLAQFEAATAKAA